MSFLEKQIYNFHKTIKIKRVRIINAFPNVKYLVFLDRNHSTGDIMI